MNKILQILKEVREKKGCQQVELGAKLGMPQSHISRILSGHTDPRLSTIEDMAHILDYELILVPRELILPIKAMIEETDDQRPRFEVREDEE